MHYSLQYITYEEQHEVNNALDIKLKLNSVQYAHFQYFNYLVDDLSQTILICIQRSIDRPRYILLFRREIIFLNISLKHNCINYYMFDINRSVLMLFSI